MGLYGDEREEWMLRRSYMLDRQKMMTSMITSMSIFMVAIFIVYFLAIPLKGIFEMYEQRLAAEVDGMKRIPSIQKELEGL